MTPTNVELARHSFRKVAMHCKIRRMTARRLGVSTAIQNPDFYADKDPLGSFRFLVGKGKTAQRLI